MSHITNASHNRKQAIRMLKAGIVPKDIAKEYGQVFYCDGDGLLGQRYSDDATEALHRCNRIAKSEGLKETNHMISSVHVTKFIRGLKGIH